MIRFLSDNIDDRRTEVFILAGLFFSVFLVTFFPSLQGFDLTDHGFHITQQYFNLSSSMENSGTELYLGSEIIGHFWLRILEYPVLAWARVGGALLHSISVVFTYIILRRYFSKKVSFWSVFLVALWMAGASPIIIQYYTLPATVAVIFLWSLDSTQSNYVTKGLRIAPWYILTGMLGVYLAFSRLTLAPLIILPLIPIYIAYRKNEEHLSKLLLSYVLGLIFGLLFIVLMLSSMGLLGTYFSEISRTVYQTVSANGGPGSSSHGFTVLISRYLRDYTYAAVLTAGVLFFTEGIKLLIKPKIDYKNEHRRRLIGWSIVVVSIVAFFGAIFLRPVLLSPSWITRIMTWSITGLLIFTALWQIIVNRSFFNNHQLVMLFVLGVVVVVFSSLGSNTGIIKNRFGFWIPLSIFVATLYQWVHKNIASKKVARVMIWAGIVLLVVGGSFNIYTNVYRDSPNRLNLVHEPNLRALQWTFTTKERALWLEEIAEEFAGISRDVDVFFVNASPSLYYVMNRAPVVGNSWFFLPSVEEVKQNLKNGIEAQVYPDIVLVPTFNTLSQTWPNDKPIIDKYSTRIDIIKNVLLLPAGYHNVTTDPTYEFWIRE